MPSATQIVATLTTLAQQANTQTGPPMGRPYKVMVYDTANELCDLPEDITQGTFEDVVNGGSGTASFVVPRSFFDVQEGNGQTHGPPFDKIDYNYRVQVYLWDYDKGAFGTFPWYDGRIIEFDQEQLDNQETEQITIHCEGWAAALNDVIVTETLTPGQQPGPGQTINLEYANGYAQHLLDTYLDSSKFSGYTPIPAAMHVLLDKIEFDGTGLGQCIDTIVKQVLDNTAQTYEWWVRGGQGSSLPAVVIQPNQNPNVVATGRYTVGAAVATEFLYEWKNSTFEAERITNSINGLVNMIALYGGKDPVSQLQVYGAFKDSTSISLYGLRQKKVTNTNLISITTLSNYATAYILLNGYPQPQATMRKFYPTDRARAGQWFQIMEPSPRQLVGGAPGNINVQANPNSRPYYSTINQYVRQMRAVKVSIQFTKENLEQYVTLAAPRPYIDKAYYGAIHQALNRAYHGPNENLKGYYIESGGDWDGTNAGSIGPPQINPTVLISPPTGYFNSVAATNLPAGNDANGNDYDVLLQSQPKSGVLNINGFNAAGTTSWTVYSGIAQLKVGMAILIQDIGGKFDYLQVATLPGGNVFTTTAASKYDHQDMAQAIYSPDVSESTGGTTTPPTQFYEGDGYYEVVFSLDPLKTFGIGSTHNPGLVCINGVTPFDYDVLKLWGFTVVNGVIVGAVDLRIGAFISQQFGINLVPDSNIDYVGDWTDEHTIPVDHWIGTAATYWSPNPIDGPTHTGNAFYLTPDGSLAGVNLFGIGPNSAIAHNNSKATSTIFLVNPSRVYCLSARFNGMANCSGTFPIVQVLDAVTLAELVRVPSSGKDGRFYASFNTGASMSVVVVMNFNGTFVPNGTGNAFISEPQLEYGNRMTAYKPGLGGFFSSGLGGAGTFSRQQDLQTLAPELLTTHQKVLSGVLIPHVDNPFIISGSLPQRALMNNITVGAIVIPPVGGTTTVNTSQVQFLNGQSILITDNVSAFIGLVESGGGTAVLTVKNTGVQLGAVGATIATGALVISSGPGGAMSAALANLTVLSVTASTATGAGTAGDSGAYLQAEATGYKQATLQIVGPGITTSPCYIFDVYYTADPAVAGHADGWGGLAETSWTPVTGAQGWTPQPSAGQARAAQLQINVPFTALRVVLRTNPGGGIGNAQIQAVAV